MTEQERTRRLNIFMMRVRKTDHCWFWKGSVNKNGYGTTALGGTSSLAHRVGWMLMRGQIPHGMVMCHTCDNKRCVNPAHLYVGTMLQNSRDAWERIKFPPRHGVANGRSKLSEDDVREIRADGKSTHKELGGRYGVTDAAIRLVRIGRNWPQVT